MPSLCRPRPHHAGGLRCGGAAAQGQGRCEIVVARVDCPWLERQELADGRVARLAAEAQALRVEGPGQKLATEAVQMSGEDREGAQGHDERAAWQVRDQRHLALARSTTPEQGTAPRGFGLHVCGTGDEHLGFRDEETSAMPEAHQTSPRPHRRQLPRHRSSHAPEGRANAAAGAGRRADAEGAVQMPQSEANLAGREPEPLSHVPERGARFERGGVQAEIHLQTVGRAGPRPRRSAHTQSGDGTSRQPEQLGNVGSEPIADGASSGQGPQALAADPQGEGEGTPLLRTQRDQLRRQMHLRAGEQKQRPGFRNEQALGDADGSHVAERTDAWHVHRDVDGGTTLAISCQMQGRLPTSTTDEPAAEHRRVRDRGRGGEVRRKGHGGAMTVHQENGHLRSRPHGQHTRQCRRMDCRGPTSADRDQQRWSLPS
mmetsp:Transcript_84887/g.238957  ORF Transcript_84887/g.238957 Transcript_84887/m.238957 type:complete len:430 (-) Transcript_84887:1104-2393(-)